MEYESPSKERLLKGIHPGMKPDKAFFLKAYGYEISFPGFAGEAIKALNDAGRSNAREYYNMVVAEYQRKRDEELRPVASQIREQWERDWEKIVEEGEEKRIINAEVELLERKRTLLVRKSQISTSS